MVKLSSVVPVAILVFIIYILFTGSITPYDVITGLIVSIVCGLLFGELVVKDPRKCFDPRRWAWAIVYFIKYMTVIEAKAHLNVIKRTLTLDIKPGIVRVPIKVKNDYARILVAHSITNTPGTVTVDMDDDYIYVNWINVVTEEPEEAKRHISEEFEKFAERIFE
ncbi:MAG: cation:proton antiporter [Thermoplasmata archaeon]|nr:Na+/H+ antiporter subunit E [Euryarchaeota archaeon]RLF66208.1 MAG: cation:proton antiporter [Thermoplasmata archaeon]